MDKKKKKKAEKTISCTIFKAVWLGFLILRFRGAEMRKLTWDMNNMNCRNWVIDFKGGDGVRYSRLEIDRNMVFINGLLLAIPAQGFD